ncbi:MAG: GIY-YIG nuclease family protein [Patescibacteria group bacterium]|nr:GIY-YIG nuclease family protein [Patescibacteria group bacterium]
MFRYYVYIMTNERNTVLYTGVTNNIERRLYEHKNGLTKGFTSKYNVTKLVYAEEYNDVCEAIEREKQIKAGSRKKKVELIESLNSDWVELDALLD